MEVREIKGEKIYERMQSRYKKKALNKKKDPVEKDFEQMFKYLHQTLVIVHPKYE